MKTLRVPERSVVDQASTAAAASALQPNPDAIQAFAGRFRSYLRRRRERRRVSVTTAESQIAPSYLNETIPQLLSLYEEATANAFCPTGKGGGVDPSCSPRKPGSGSGVFSSRDDAREQFLSIARKSLKESEGDDSVWREIGEDRATLHLPKDRFIDVVMKEKWEGGGTKFDARVDFGVRGRSDTSVGSVLESESIGMLRRVRDVVRAYHEAGFRIEVGPSDDRRRELYSKFLSKMGLNLVREGKSEVWNAFCPTGKGGGVDPTCSPGGKPGPKTKVRTQHRMRQAAAGKSGGKSGKAETMKPTPTPAPTPKVVVDYDQADPHHPEARKVRDDHEGRRRLESFLAKTSEMGKDGFKLQELRDKAHKLGSDHHTATTEWLKLAKSKSKAKSHAGKLKAAKATMDRLRAEHNEAIAARNEAIKQADTLPARGRAALLEVMGVSSPSPVSYRSKGKKTYDWETEGLDPTGATKTAMDDGLGFAARLTGGGHRSEVTLSLSTDGRAHYIAGSPTTGAIVMGRTTGDLVKEAGEKEAYPGRRKHLTEDTTRTAVHEVGHHYENTIPGLQDKARAFLDYRLQGEPVIQMNRKPGMSSLRDDEHGAKDRFDKAFSESDAYYIGKQYHRDTEVVSMGLQKLYEDPVRFAQKDPEYFQWLTTALRGGG